MAKEPAPDLGDRRLLWGKPIASDIERQAIVQRQVLDSVGLVPRLAIVYCGDHEDAASYRRTIHARAARVGVAVGEIRLAEQAPVQEVADTIQRLNGDRAVHAVLLQNPLSVVARRQGMSELLPAKDVEGLTAENLGRLMQGVPSVRPCTPEAIMAIVRTRIASLAGKRVVVVNRSATIGRPLTQLLLDDRATVTVCSTATVDLPSETRRAEILVVAIGRARAIGGDYVGQGAIVIDVGINADPAGSGICGDVDTEAVLPLVSAVTPVPGGVGPVTTAVMIANVVRLAVAQTG